MNYEALAKSQQEDQELKSYLHKEKGLQLTQTKISETELFDATQLLKSLIHSSQNHFVGPPFKRSLLPHMYQSLYEMVIPLENQEAETIAKAFYRLDCSFWSPALHHN